MNGTTNNTRERLARKQLGKTLQGASGGAPQSRDALHNVDTPCCMLVQQAIVDVLPEMNSQQKEEEPSILGKMIRQYLMEQQDNNTTTTTSKKKRKRKKKKKGASATHTIQEESATISGQEEARPTETVAVEKQQQQEEEAVVTNDLKPSSSPPQDNHDKTSPPASDTVLLLQKWLQQHAPSSSTTTMDENRSVSSFLQYLETNHVYITLDYTRAQEAIQSIACPACLQVTTSYSRHECTLVPFIRISSHSMDLPTNTTSTSISNVEHAFDYVAMEEGESNSDAIVVLHRSTCNKNNDIQFQSQDALTLQDFHVLLTNLILTHGVNPERLAQDPDYGDNATFSLVDEQYTRIIGYVLKQEEEFTTELKEIRNRIHIVQNMIQNANMVVGHALDVKTSSQFLEAEQVLDTCLEQMLKLVQTMVNQHYVMSSSFQQQHDDTTLSNKFQEVYSWIAESISALLQAQLAHVARILQLAARPGVVPQLAVNVQHRTSFQSLLVTKISILQELHQSLYQLLIKDYTCRTIWTREQLHDFFQSTPNNTTTLDNDEDLFWNTTRTMTRSISPCVRVDELKQEQVQRTKAWMTCIVGIITAESNNNNTDVPQHLLDRYEQLTVEAVSLQQIVDTESDEDAREEAIPQFATVVCEMFRNVLNQTLHIRQRNNNNDTPRLFVPPRLYDFLRGKNNNGPCQGGGGKRRATGILVGLVYEWLKDRCNEWHAELTQNELLESVLVEGDNVKPTKSSKKSKKKRDREKKNAAATAAVEVSEIVPVELVADALSTDAVLVDKRSNDDELGSTLSRDDTANEGVVEKSDSSSQSFHTADDDATDSSPDVAAVKSAEKVIAASTIDRAQESSPNVVSKSTEEIVSVDINVGTEEALTEWRAELMQNGLSESAVDELIGGQGEDGEIKETEEFTVAKSKKSKRKRAKKKNASSATTAGGSIPQPAKLPVSSTDAATSSISVNRSAKKPDAPSAVVGRGTKAARASDHDGKPAEKHNPGTKEAVDHGRPGAKSANSKETKEELENKKPTQAIPANIMSAVSKSHSPKAAKDGARTSKDGTQPSKNGTQTPERGTKDKGPKTPVDSKRGPELAPLKRSVPADTSVEVGVVSPTGFQSAEGFLVQRLMAVLRDEGI